MQQLRFNQKPYQVVFKDFHTGELKRVTRRPPAKLHDILPTDIVELTSKKNDDFDVGDQATVKHINYRAPNVIQLKNDEGLSTFVDYQHLKVEETVGYREVEQIDSQEANRYLLWP